MPLTRTRRFIRLSLLCASVCCAGCASNATIQQAEVFGSKPRQLTRATHEWHEHRDARQARVYGYDDRRAARQQLQYDFWVLIIDVFMNGVLSGD